MGSASGFQPPVSPPSPQIPLQRGGMAEADSYGSAREESVDEETHQQHGAQAGAQPSVRKWGQRLQAVAVLQTVRGCKRTPAFLFARCTSPLALPGVHGARGRRDCAAQITGIVLCANPLWFANFTGFVGCVPVSRPRSAQPRAARGVMRSELTVPGRAPSPPCYSGGLGVYAVAKERRDLVVTVRGRGGRGPGPGDARPDSSMVWCGVVWWVWWFSTRFSRSWSL